MIGNEEKTEQMLKTTKEHGVILMSIKSIWSKVAIKNQQNQQAIYFIQVNAQEDGSESQNFGKNEAFDQLDTIKAYIQGFDDFCGLLNETVENVDGKPSRTK